MKNDCKCRLYARIFQLLRRRNRFQGINSASQCRYDNPISTRFLAPIDYLKKKKYQGTILPFQRPC
jgi:hypothetical protein